MDQALNAPEMSADRNRKLSAAIRDEQARLRNFIRKRVPDPADAEDILQDVFYEFLEADHLIRPIEHVGAWLYRVARNRIIDLFRKKKAGAFADLPATLTEDGEQLRIEDLLPSREASPEAAYARSVLVEELEAALDELPAGQREAFISHELEGRSFKELAAETGLSVNALILRKHYAVLHLRKRLQAIYDEFTKS
jgi:RNA polymerase sigma factor (sigma-70 family)